MHGAPVPKSDSARIRLSYVFLFLFYSLYPFRPSGRSFVPPRASLFSFPIFYYSGNFSEAFDRWLRRVFVFLMPSDKSLRFFALTSVLVIFQPTTLHFTSFCPHGRAVLPIFLPSLLSLSYCTPDRKCDRPVFGFFYLVSS